MTLTNFEKSNKNFEKYKAIRNEAIRFKELLTTLCPSSHELSVAQVALETAVMWACASIRETNEKE